MEDKILVLIEHNDESEPEAAYRLNETTFEEIAKNWEIGHQYFVSLVYMTPKEWAECQKAGDGDLI